MQYIDLNRKGLICVKLYFNSTVVYVFGQTFFDAVRDVLSVSELLFEQRQINESCKPT